MKENNKQGRTNRTTRNNPPSISISLLCIPEPPSSEPDKDCARSFGRSIPEGGKMESAPSPSADRVVEDVYVGPYWVMAES